MSDVAIQAAFPYPIVDKIHGAPSYKTLAKLNIQLNANAASILPTIYPMGLLGLTVTPNTYQLMTGSPWNFPPNPGQIPVIGHEATSAQIAAATNVFNQAKKTYETTLLTDKLLKKQLLEAVEERFYKSLRNRHTGYAGVPTLQLLQHLKLQYGKVTEAELEENDRALKTPYDVQNPIETLYEQVEDAINFADAADTLYTQQQILSIALSLIQKTGVFTDWIREWKRKNQLHKTWPLFKEFFAEAHQEFRDNPSSNNFGFGNANIAESLNNLAAATASDRSAVSSLSSMNSELLAQLAETNAKLATAMNEIKGLKLKITSFEPANSATTTEDPPQRRGQRFRGTRHTVRVFHNKNYCWSHGYDLHPLHTSATCLHKKDGHKDEATFKNNMGGSQRYKFLVTGDNAL